MIKHIIKFIFLINLVLPSIDASTKSPFESLDKSIFGCVIEFLDIPSIARVKCLSKSVNLLFEKLENTHKEKYPILDSENLLLLKTCMSDFQDQHKDNLTSISPFAFSTHLIEKAKEDKKLQSFMDGFINTLLEDKRNMLIHWQSMMIRQKIFKPFLKKIIKKEKDEEWNTIFETQLFENEECLETQHPYYILPFAFFWDQGVPMDYEVKKFTPYLGTTVVEFVAITGFHDLIVFLLKNGAEVNRLDSIEPCLYLAVRAYIFFNEKSDKWHNARKSILLFLRHNPRKHHYIMEQDMKLLEYVQQNITDKEILKYFKEEN